jgi:putative DNA primase/helicase
MGQFEDDLLEDPKPKRVTPKPQRKTEPKPVAAVSETVDEFTARRQRAVRPDGPFNAPTCAKALTKAEPYAIGGSQLYGYRDGYYQPFELLAQQNIVQLLGDDWRRRYADEIIAYQRVTSPELWEQPPLNVINTPSGLLNVKTRKLSPHSPAHLSPVRIAAAFDSGATCPAIDTYLESTVPELILLVEEILGYLMVPDNSLQRAIMLLGPGGTGKSTLTRLIAAFIGSENIASVALHKLEDDRFAVADLYGRLVNIFADLDSRALKSASMFKTITGGDAVRGERKHRDPFTFTPYARLVFSANTPPPTADSSDAFFDRWVILPFEQKHRNTKHCDSNIIDKLTTPSELSGLLNRALDGLERVHKQHGFTRIEGSENAAERFRVDSDSVAGFLEERCSVEDDGKRIGKPELFRAYRDWCADNNRTPFGAARFNRRLLELKPTLQITSSKGRDSWLGIDLRSSW